MTIVPTIGQHLQLFTGNGDVSIWVKNSRVGRKTTNKQTNVNDVISGKKRCTNIRYIIWSEKSKLGNISVYIWSNVEFYFVVEQTQKTIDRSFFLSIFSTPKKFNSQSRGSIRMKPKGERIIAIWYKISSFQIHTAIVRWTSNKSILYLS